VRVTFPAPIAPRNRLRVDFLELFTSLSMRARGHRICWTLNSFVKTPNSSAARCSSGGRILTLRPFVNSEKRRRDILQEVEALRGERNKASKEIGH